MPVINGTTARDILDGSDGDDVINGLAGNDWLRGEGGDDVLNGDDGDDTLGGGFGLDILNGGNGRDLLYASIGVDNLFGDAGNDFFDLRYAAAVDGGADTDTASFNFSRSLDPLGLNLADLWALGTGDFNGQTVTGIEVLAPTITGSQYDDTIVIGDYLSTTPLFIDGGDGNDFIFGSIGGDYINGEDGSDILEGNAGNDVFQLSAGYDVIIGGAGIDSVLGGASARRNGDGSITLTSGINTTNVTEVEKINGLNTAESVTNDVNADGTSDLVYFSSAAHQIGWQTVTGGVAQPAIAPIDYISGIVQATGDVNADGFADYAINNNGTIDLWTSANPANGTGPQYLQSVGVFGSEWNVAALADIDGNLQDDTILRNSTNGRVYIFMNGTLGADTTVTNDLGVLGSEWNVAGTGDFDNDGDDDILLRNDTTGQVYLYNMENGKVASGTNIATFGTDWNVDGVGDFNNDGLSDIALKNTATGQFYLLLTDQGGGYTGSSLGTIGTDWSIATVGDYNADGTDDLIWRNSTTNQVYLWAMQDGHQAATGSMSYGVLAADQVLV
jgi:hypothetical protein